MKAKLMLATLLLCIFSASAQKIAKNEVDKFTGNSIIETKHEYLFHHNFAGLGYDYAFLFSIRKVNHDSYTMPCRILLRNIEKYDTDSCIIFLLENGNTIKLYTLYTGIGADKFAQGYYFDTVLNMTDEDVAQLKASKITDIRIDYFGGHYDYAIKGKNQDMVIRMIKLIGGSE